MQYLFVWLITLSAIVGNTYKLSFFSPDIRISILDIFVVIFSTFGLVFQSKAVLHQIRKSASLSKYLISFLGFSLLSIFWVNYRFGNPASIVAFMYWFRLSAFSIFSFVLAAYLKKEIINFSLILIGLTFSISGTVQYLLYPDIRHLSISDWDPHYYRVVGTLLDPGYIGIILVLFLVYLYQRPIRNLFYQYIFTVLTYIILALTYSRSSFLALLAVAGSISYSKRSWKPLLLTGAVLMMTLFILPRSPDGEGVKLERTSSITARIQNWKNSLSIISTNPVIGVGYNAYRYAQKQAGFLGKDNWLRSHSGAGADSSILFITATTGIVGITLYGLYLKQLYSLKGMKHSLVALLVHSLFLNSLVYPFVLLWFSFLIALSLTNRQNK